MAFEVRFNDEQAVNLDDLPPEVFEEIAKDDPETSWWVVYRWPGGKPDRLYAVVCAAAAHLGIDPPAKPTTMREACDLLELVQTVPDIEDQPAMNGFPQVPGRTEIGSSSGLPGGTDGLPTLSDVNDSATS